MFTKVFTIENVNHEFQTNDEFLYVSMATGGLLKYDMKKDIVLWKSATIEGSSRIFISRNIVLVNSGLNSILLESLDGKLVGQYDYKVLDSNSNSCQFLTSTKQNGKSIIKVLDSTLSVVLESEIKLGRNILFLNDFLVHTKFLNDQCLIGRNLVDLSETWQFELTSEDSFLNTRLELSSNLILNILGEAQDLIWIAVSSGSLYAVEKVTGKVLFIINQSNCSFTEELHSSTANSYIPYGEFIQLDKKKSELIGLRDYYFMFVDLMSDKLERKYIDVRKSMDSFGIRSSYRNYSFPCDSNFIYFCDDRKGKIGVFDRIKLEVVWTYQLELETEEIAQILDMKYEDDRWYVLDRKNVLHVFKRD